MQDVLVSVIIPTYNRARTLRRAIRSVLNQSHRNLELIVVDDGSTDETPEVIAEFDDPRLRYVRHETNRYAGAARNTGIRMARGEFVAFQDSDDEFLVDKIARQAAALAAAPAETVGCYCVKICYGRDERIRYGVRKSCCIPAENETGLSGDLRQKLYRDNCISTQTLMIKKSAVDHCGYFDENIKNSLDWDFVLRLAEVGPIVYVDEPLVVAYSSADSISLVSRKSVYSQIVIMNKMRRRGVPKEHLAHHVSRLGRRLAGIGRRRAGLRFLARGLMMNPADRLAWLRYGAHFADGLRARLGGRRGAATGDGRAALR